MSEPSPQLHIDNAGEYEGWQDVKVLAIALHEVLVRISELEAKYEGHTHDVYIGHGIQSSVRGTTPPNPPKEQTNE